MRRTVALVVSVASLLGATLHAVSAEVIGVDRVDRRAAVREVSTAGSRYVIGAAGDIACPSDPHGGDAPSTCQYDDTAQLLVGTGLDRVLTLGDNQYDAGGYADYLAYFDPTWGRVFDRISPVPGNHEYGQDPSSRPRGYFRYFGRAVKGPDGLGYYSYDVGACPDTPCWHFVALSSELCFASGGCDEAGDPTDPGPGERMYEWLRADLAASDRACTLAYWHHPRFSHSTGSGATAAVGPLWDLLYDAHADVVLNGHSHNYQRWAPQDPGGHRDRVAGIREFVVGTGGVGHYAIAAGDPPRNLVVAQADAFGILRIALKASGYAWEWVSAAGQPAFEDSGRASCV